MKLVPWNSGMSLGDVWIPMRDNWFLDSAVKGCWHTSQAQTYSDSSGAVSIPIWAFGEDIRRKARFTEGAARNFLGFTVLSEVSDRHGTQDTMPPALALKLKSIWHRMEQFPWPALGKISNPAGISASTLGFFLAGLPLAPLFVPPLLSFCFFVWNVHGHRFGEAPNLAFDKGKVEELGALVGYLETPRARAAPAGTGQRRAWHQSAHSLPVSSSHKSQGYVIIVVTANSCYSYDYVYIYIYDYYNNSSYQGPKASMVYLKQCENDSWIYQ